MKDLIQAEIETPDGVGIIEQVYITELGHIMLRIFFKKKGIWINKRISSIESVLEGTNFKLNGNFKLKKIKPV